MNKKKLPKAIRPADTEPARATAKRRVPSRTTLSEATMQTEAASADAAEMTPESRRATAVKLVERFSLWSGAAGLIPVPFVDLATVGGLQIQMLRRLSQIYEVPFSKNQGKSIIAGLAGSMIPATSALGTASLMKGVPVFGALISATGDAGAIRRRHLRDRHGVHRALCFRRHAARFQSQRIQRVHEVAEGDVEHPVESRPSS